ncbi:class I SAM-dependent methyltransferase [Sulfurimonas paralvinellae]|uniref:Class I SAM-dependent methyltransferase n=1 Tax=Sulfurimonas paralvinellae TaxID=317658 RepID=A0A7M1B563_9BACT|nr:class I SAM-dependent methyltransferase [Sulfurimonas paralvinellae]QOP44869.1 class I SAM-dependent methyltransferase [Sulfurimonas paralvinellae]
MPRIDSEAFYKNAIKKHGITPAGVCWLSYAHQQIRFETICELLPDNLETFTLTDAGCGFGDFYLYLQNAANKPKQYIGIDSIDAMCTIAKQRTSQDIFSQDITNSELPVSDYVICSGAMNVLTPFETIQFMQNCFKASKKAFIFNILYGENNSATYNYLTQESLQKIASELSVADMRLREGYLDGDITVGFFK